MIKDDAEECVMDRRKHCEMVIELRGQVESIREMMEKDALERREWRENLNLSIGNLERKVSQIMTIADRLYFPYKITILIFVGGVTFLATKIAEHLFRISGK